MNGLMCWHWGLITWPDNDWKKNVLINEDGSIQKFEDKLPMKVQTKFPPEWSPGIGLGKNRTRLIPRRAIGKQPRSLARPIT